MATLKTLIGNVRGPQGIQGEQGIQGPQGVTGPQGPAGADGKTMYRHTLDVLVSEEDDTYVWFEYLSASADADGLEGMPDGTIGHEYCSTDSNDMAYDAVIYVHYYDDEIPGYEHQLMNVRTRTNYSVVNVRESIKPL